MAEKSRDSTGALGTDRTPTAAKSAAVPSRAESRERKSASLRQVPVFKLKSHRLQPSARHADENVRDLMLSIEQIGLQEPPLIRRTSAGEYEILAGHRRVRAWQMLALNGRVKDKIRAYILSDISDRDAVYIISAEYAHREDYDLLHTANVIGSAFQERRAEIGREPTAREVADVIPWKESSIASYCKVYEALLDPSVAPLLQRLERPRISLLYKILCVTDFRRKVAALNAYHAEGPAGVKLVLDHGKRGRPQAPVVKKSLGKGKGYDVTLRMRPSRSTEEIEAQLKTLEDLTAELRQKLADSQMDEAG